MSRTTPVDARPLRSESGVVGVGTVITLGLVGLAAYLLLAAFEADTAHYGKVPVPSEGGAIELPEGEVDVYYAEDIKPDSAAPLLPPADLQFTIADSEGIGVRTDVRGGDPEETDDGMARVVGAAFPPAEGTYIVNVTSDGTAGLITPELTFGQGPLQAVADRFDEVVEELKGTTGVVVVVVLILLLVVPAFQRAMKRR